MQKNLSLSYWNSGNQMPRWLYPEGAFHAGFVNIRNAVVGKFENTLLALFVAVTVLLLMACSNVANLLLPTRASAREGEMKWCVSPLGVSRGRLIRQMLTESLALRDGRLRAGVLLARLVTGTAVARAPNVMHCSRTKLPSH